MSISVVIPTCNRNDTIIQAINSIAENTIKPDEIIVVDQGIGDLKEILVKQFPALNIRYILDKGQGAARSRNIGWRASKYEIVAFTDDDAFTDKQWIESIINSLSLPNFKAGAVGGKIIPVYKERNPDWEIPKKWEFVLPAYEQGEAVNIFTPGALPPSVNLAVPRHILEACNGFKETLGTHSTRQTQIFGEDSDLTLRIKQMGYDIIYHPQCTVFHPVPLHRQNQQFLNKRLYIEGYTDAYLDVLHKNFTLTNKIYILYIKLRELFALYTGKSENPIEGEAKKHLLKGYLSSFLKFGFFKKSL